MKISGLSASSYSTYSLCQWKYFINAVLKIKDASGPSAMLGHAGHSSCEIMSKMSLDGDDCNRLEIINDVLKDINLDVLPELANDYDLIGYLWDISYDYYTKQDPATAEKIQKNKIKKVRNGLFEICDSYYTPLNPKTICAEQYFRIPIEEPGFKCDNGDWMTVRGLIDRVDKISDDVYEIIDYKTGMRKEFCSANKNKYDNITLRDNIQPRTYHYAATKLWPDVKTFLITFHYWCDGGPVTMPFDESDVFLTKQKIYKRFAAIKNNNSPSRNQSWHCKHICYYGGKTGICDRLWKEKNECGIEFVELKQDGINKANKNAKL